jgi:predicted transcriptional regulator of viral defense system
MRSAPQTVARRRDLLAQGYTARSLRAALNQGELNRLSRDLYFVTKAEDAITEKHTYVQVARLVPKGVFCLISAAVFHELTTQVNHRMQIALPRPAFEPKVPLIDVKYFHVSPEPFAFGIEEHHVEGTVLKVYSPAKTVADLFKFRNQLGRDLAVEALRDVWRNRKATVGQLHTAAKICRVHKIMEPYLEATIW